MGKLVQVQHCPATVTVFTEVRIPAPVAFRIAVPRGLGKMRRYKLLPLAAFFVDAAS